MRKTFERAGFVKEAHLRNAWFSPKENSYYDAVTYGITREDFHGGNDNACYLGRWRKSTKWLQHHRVFRTFRIHLNRNGLLFVRRNWDALDVWNAIRNSLPALRSGCHWRNRNPSCM